VGFCNVMEARKFDLLMLALMPGVHPRVRAALLSAADLSEVLAHPGDHRDRLPGSALASVASGELRKSAEHEVEGAQRAGIQLLAWGESGYPELLAHTADPPPVLWVRGTLVAADWEAGIGIVGSRQATGAGRALARGMARDLARAGATIVSGLALGIDGEAHRGALDAGGRTVAVLGSGLAQVYPASHARLAEQIVDAGALVSEFALETPPYKGNFPRRNRVIAGWTSGVVVVEAAARSGALVTARVALEEGREVMAVPGHPTCATAEGTNALIRDGAVLVRGAADVAEQLGLALAPAEAGTAEPLLEALRPDAPLSLDELQRKSGVPVPALLQRLGELELERKVQRLPGALFVRAL
jgi:DNA processing protein